MKTVNDLENMEASIRSDIELLELVPRDEISSDRKARLNRLTKARRNLSAVRHVLMYIKTNPSEEYIKAEIARLNKRLKAIDHGYVLRRDLITRELTLMQEKAVRSEYNKELGVPKLCAQLKVMRFILG